MNVNDYIKKLSQAESLVKEVRDALNVESTICEHCGLTNYKHFGQFQTRDALNAVLNRLDKTLERMNQEPEIFA